MRIKHKGVIPAKSLDYIDRCYLLAGHFLPDEDALEVIQIDDDDEGEPEAPPSTYNLSDVRKYYPLDCS